MYSWQTFGISQAGFSKFTTCYIPHNQLHKSTEEINIYLAFCIYPKSIQAADTNLLYFVLHVLFVSHETFCFYQTVSIFIYSAYKLQVCS